MRPAPWICALGILASTLLATGRTTNGLVAFYDFATDEGKIIHDRSGTGEPINLEIQDPKGVRRRPGNLEIIGETRIQSKVAPTKLLEAIQASNALTVEAWIHPANTQQEGPARIVSFSKTTSHRNFTLGQEKDTYDFRLRTTRLSSNGMPSLASPRRSVQTALTHLAYTRDNSGQARLYINGEQKAQRVVPGDMGNWDKSHRLTLANELNANRPWKGIYYLVAIYSRALPPDEIQENFQEQIC